MCSRDVKLLIDPGKIRLMITYGKKQFALNLSKMEG